MEQMRQTIEAKYWWKTDLVLAFDWAELAENEGCDGAEIADFVASKLFQKAA